MSLRARLPSSGSLFMFEAAARHGNFTLAAREFNVTQPAISRMILGLERHLGTALFLRKPGGLELTENGRLLHRAVHDGFERIEDVVREIQTAQHEANIVTLSVTSAFAIHWLMPRFERFRREVPEVSIRLDLIHGEPTVPLGGADIGLRYDIPKDEDLEVWPLVEEVVIPVCSLDYLHSNGPIDGPCGVKGHVLAGLIGRMRIPWATFVPAVGVGSLSEATELGFSDYALVIQGAIKGQAVALGWWHVVAGELLNNGLVPAGRSMLQTGAFYQLVARRVAARRLAVQKVRDWMQAEFAALEVHRVGMNLTVVKPAARRSFPMPTAGKAPATDTPMHGSS